MEAQVEKPPIGLRPRWIVQALRIREILEAMDRYNSVEKPIPQDWCDELNELFAAQREADASKRETARGCRCTTGELKFPL